MYVVLCRLLGPHNTIPCDVIAIKNTKDATSAFSLILLSSVPFEVVMMD